MESVTNYINNYFCFHFDLTMTIGIITSWEVARRIFKYALSYVRKPDIIIPNDFHEFNKTKHELHFERNDEAISYITKFYTLNVDKYEVDFPHEQQPENQTMTMKETFIEFYWFIRLMIFGYKNPTE